MAGHKDILAAVFKRDPLSDMSGSERFTCFLTPAAFPRNNSATDMPYRGFLKFQQVFAGGLSFQDGISRL
jgi:hypothetical protein